MLLHSSPGWRGVPTELHPRGSVFALLRPHQSLGQRVGSNPKEASGDDPGNRNRSNGTLGGTESIADGRLEDKETLTTGGTARPDTTRGRRRRWGLRQEEGNCRFTRVVGTLETDPDLPLCVSVGGTQGSNPDRDPTTVDTEKTLGTESWSGVGLSEGHQDPHPSRERGGVPSTPPSSPRPGKALGKSVE